MIRGLARWVRLVLLPMVLRRSPTPRWSRPALPLALARFLFDREAHRVAGPALHAVDRPSARLARWRFVWAHCYQHETDLLLALQAERLTRAWACAHVAPPEALPDGGAILITLHHAHLRLGNLRLSTLVEPFGIIAGLRVDELDARTPALFHRPMAILYRRIFGPHVIYPQPAAQAARQGLRLLNDGGYLVIAVDGQGTGDFGTVLGKTRRIPRGAVWLARHSRKPIIPLMVVPDGRGWRVWCGEPVAPTTTGMAGAIEACIRQAPTSWRLGLWSCWLTDPPAA